MSGVGHFSAVPTAPSNVGYRGRPADICSMRVLRILTPFLTYADCNSAMQRMPPLAFIVWSDAGRAAGRQLFRRRSPPPLSLVARQARVLASRGQRHVNDFAN